MIVKNDVNAKVGSNNILPSHVMEKYDIGLLVSVASAALSLLPYHMFEYRRVNSSIGFQLPPRGKQ